MLTEIDFVSNPYARAKIVELVFYMCDLEKGTIRTCVRNNLSFRRNITKGLANFYIDIEFTGDDSSFYQKYVYRHYVSMIFKYIWTMPEYQAELKNLLLGEREL